VKIVQHISYKQEIQDLQDHKENRTKSNLKGLHPFLDQQGIVSLEGTLQHSSLPYQAIRQMIFFGGTTVQCGPSPP
jgi:hypothetical protein